jgi:hypothetical protein
MHSQLEFHNQESFTLGHFNNESRIAIILQLSGRYHANAILHRL